MERLLVNCLCLWFIGTVLLVAGAMWLHDVDEIGKKAFQEYLEERKREGK